MKRIFLFFFLFMYTFNLNAQEVQFSELDWDDLHEEATKQNKYVMVDAYTDWCGWCKVQDKKTFKDPMVAKFMNANFISKKFNFEKDFGIKLAAKFKIRSFPSLLFFNPQGQLVKVFTGYTEDNNEFVEKCKTVLDIKEKQPFAYDSQNIDADFPDFYYHRFDPKLKKDKIPQETVDAYLSKQKNLLSEESWAVIRMFKIGDKFKKYVLKKHKKYRKNYGDDEVNMFVDSYFYSKYFSPSIKAKDEKMLNKGITFLDKYYVGGDLKDRKENIQLAFYKSSENWDNYTQIVEKKMPQFKEKDNHGSINSISWTYYEKIEDREALKMATQWMADMTKKHPEYMYLDTYAALLYKINDYEKAKMIAEKAIKMGKENGEKVGETETLLEKIMEAKGS